MTSGDGGAARVTRSQATAVVRETVRFALGIWLTGVLGRGLDDAGFGFVAFVGTIYALAQLALDLGSGALIAREIAKEPARERPLLEAALAWRGAIGLVAGLVVAGVAAAEDDPERRQWLLIVAASLPLLAPNVLGVAFQVRQDLGPPSLLGVLLQAGMLGSALLFVDLRVVPAAFAALYVVRETAGPLLLWSVARMRLGLRLSPGVFGRDTRRLFGSAAAQATVVVLQTLMFHAPTLALKAADDDASLGRFAAASRLINPVLLLVGALTAPLLPVLSATWKTRPDAARSLIDAALGLAAYLGFAGWLVVATAGDLVLALIYGAPAAPATETAFVRLGAAFGCVCVGSVLTTSCLAVGRERPLRSVYAAALAVVSAFLIGALRGEAEEAPATAGMATFAAEAVAAFGAWVALRSAARPVEGRSLVGRGFLAAAAVVVGALALVTGGAPSHEFSCRPIALGVAALPLGVALLGPPFRRFRAALRECAA